MRTVLLVLYLLALPLFPLWLRRREALRLRQMEECLSMLRQIRREISCYARPLPEICRSLDLPTLSDGGFNPRESIDDPASSFRRAKNALLLPREATELLCSFFEHAGSGFRDEEVGGCDYYIDLLSEMTREEREEGPNRVRVKSTLVLTAGLLFLLLVL